MMAWHDTPLAQHLIVTMHKLTDMSERFVAVAREAGERYASDDETARALGTLDWCLQRGGRHAYEASGQCDALYGRLDSLRDTYVSDEWSRQMKARGIEHGSDAGDDVYEEINAATLSTDGAIRLWVNCEAMRLAA